MGEAKRRQHYNTLDGGPPSNEKIVVEVVIFDPLRFLLQLPSQPLDETAGQYAAVMKSMYDRSFDRSQAKMLCSCCDYEFRYGQAPALMGYLRPFIAKGPCWTSLTGGICHSCASFLTQS